MQYNQQVIGIISLFQLLVDIQGGEGYVRFDCAISNNGMEIIDIT